MVAFALSVLPAISAMAATNDTLAYGNGNNSRTHGQIYRHEIQINTTYENPFVR